MKISVRNQISGTITAITPGAVTGQIKVDIGGGNIITPSITEEAIVDLGLAVGDHIGHDGVRKIISYVNAPRRAMPLPVRASWMGRTVAACFPLKARAASGGASGALAGARTDWLALTTRFVRLRDRKQDY